MRVMINYSIVNYYSLSYYYHASIDWWHSADLRVTSPQLLQLGCHHPPRLM